MILEAFAKTLQRCFDKENGARDILQAWLTWHLNSTTDIKECDEDRQVRNVLKAEIALCEDDSIFMFQGKSDTGDVLLRSLYEYCLSYEDWQYRRWLHTVKASDFSQGSLR
jgi:hypothetical protein